MVLPNEGGPILSRNPFHNEAMTRKRTQILITIIIATAASMLLVCGGEPLGTGFTYQGQLSADGEVTDGSYDFEFSLCDAASSGTVLGDVLEFRAVEVVGGRFTVVLDFGEDLFRSDARWLEIAVRRFYDTESPPGADTCAVCYVCKIWDSRAPG